MQFSTRRKSKANRRWFLMGAASVPLGLQATPALAEPDAPVGLIFVGQSTCPYCQLIAPLLGRAQQDGLDVLYASMDGQPLYPFFDFENGYAHPLTSHYIDVPHVLVYNHRLDTLTHDVSGVRSLRHFIYQLSAAIEQSVKL